MSDFESFRRDVGAQVLPPDFDDVLAVGGRRRLAAVGWSAASVAAVVGVVALGIQGGYGNQGAPVAPANSQHTPSRTTSPPSPSTTTPPLHQPLSPTAVVNDKGSYLTGVAVSAASSDVKAAAWQHCIDGRHNCERPQYALTVTDDNFATSHDVALTGQSWPTVTAVAPDRFYASAGNGAWLVATDGSVTRVSFDRQPGPIAAGEVFVGAKLSPSPPAMQNRSNTYLAVDPATGVSHPLSTPRGTNSLVQNTGGTLVGVVIDNTGGFHSSAIWSTDGGATWAQQRLVSGTSELTPIPSTATSGVMAFVRGGLTATVFPFNRVYRSTDGGATWATFDESQGHGGDQPYVGWSLVAPDGSLLVNIEAWSMNRRGHPGPHPVGLYESNGANWSDLHYVPGLPSWTGSGPHQLFSDAPLAGYAVTPSGELRVWIEDSSHGRLYESVGGTGTWQQVPTR